MKYGKWIGLVAVLLVIWGLVSQSYRRGMREGRLDAINTLEDSAAQIVETVDSLKAIYADSLAHVDSAVAATQRRAYRYRQQVDTLTRALERTREDDDSIPLLVKKIAAKDSVIAALEDRDLERLRAIALLRAQSAEQDSAIVRLRANGLEATQAARKAILASQRRPLDYVGMGACAVAGYGAGTDQPIIFSVGAIGCALHVAFGR